MPNNDSSFVQVCNEEIERAHPHSKALECIKAATQGDTLDEAALLKKLLEYAKALKENESCAKD